MAFFKFSDGAGVPVQHSFSNQSTIIVNHGLGFPPSVWIVVSGDLVHGQIVHNNTATFTVTFQTSETGVIYYR